MFKKFSILAFSAFAFLFLLTQCSSDSNDDTPSSSSVTPSSSSEGLPSSSSEEPSSSSELVVAPSKLVLGYIYFGTDSTSGATNSFVEIYNPNNETVTLTGKYALHYRTMQRTIVCTAGCRDDEAEQATVLASPLRMQEWLKLNLVGEIPAHHSFLVHMGQVGENPQGRLNLMSKVFDQNFEEAYLYKYNKGIKVVITSNQNSLSPALKNPFTGDGAGQIAGYMDMFGLSGNDAGYVDQDVDGCESLSGVCRASHAEGQSRQKGFARIKTTQAITGIDADGEDIITQILISKYVDTDDNLADFEMFDYRASDVTNPAFIPRGLTDGPWSN
jgi:hypothetical protein